MLLRYALRLFVLVVAMILLVPATAWAQASPSPDVSALSITQPPQGQVLPPRGVRIGEQIKVWVELKDAPLAVANGEHAKQRGARLSRSEQQQYVRNLRNRQDEVAAQVRARGGRELARVSKAHNAVAFSVDPRNLDAIRTLAGVKAVRPVVDYQLDLSETVPYIGATAVQNLGYDGTGVRVAVLDSGIDYTHKNLMGSGTAADYTAAFGTSLTDVRHTVIPVGLYPTAKVVGGYDFVGEAWTGAANSPPLAPDPNPIPCGSSVLPCNGDHGTHVADIIAGKSLDGTHKGVAPGAQLLAVKVCSSITSSCSGVALLQGMDFAMDPNGDGDTSDAVDVINLSLGSAYGQKEDDLSFACANAVRAGVVVVASAGNNGNRPYIVGSPSSTPEVLSVAETAVPSAKLQWIAQGTTNVVSSLFQPWSAPLAATISGPLAYGLDTNKLGCDAFPANSLTGKIVLVDRGICAVSLKISNIFTAGGVLGIVANNVATGPGEPPPSFSFGGGTPNIPGFTVTQADGLILRGLVGQTLTVDPANFAAMVHSVVASSSRGPDMSFSAVKPEIGAPGASVSALAGSGDKAAAFGGTSGAAPMVAGSAALLLSKESSLTPAEVKGRLVTTAETNTYVNPATLPGYLAEITRIGGGEVRVDKAVNATAAAWDPTTLGGSLSFGYNAAPMGLLLEKSFVVRNFRSSSRVFSINPGFRYADDAASGAVRFWAPRSVSVPGNGTATVTVDMIVEPLKLPTWTLNGGSRGGDGYRLAGVEYDGNIVISDSNDTIHLPWQVLPHKAAAVIAPNSVKLNKKGQRDVLLANFGLLDGRVDVFALLGTSPQIPKADLPQPGDNFAVIDLRYVGARLVDLGGGASGLQVAINTFGERGHPNYPAEFDVYLDTNRDGNPEYILYNAENGGFGVTGQSLVYVYNVATKRASAYFYNDADLDSANVIFTAPLSALGLSPTDSFNMSVYAFDNYFTGNLTDAVEGITFSPGVPKYTGTGIPDAGVPFLRLATLHIAAVPDGATASPSQTGLLLMYRDAVPGFETDAITVKVK